MEIDPSSLSVLDAYQWLVGLVTPRPIAWVSSLSPRGIANLAPFSFYNAFGGNPPIVAFSPALKRDGSKKDTLLNIEATRDFVIHAATQNMVDAINESSREFPYEESEADHLDLKWESSSRIKAPRLHGVPFAMECTLQQIVPLGSGPLAGNLIIGQVVYIHIDDAFLENGWPSPERLATIGRLGQDFWCHTNSLFRKARPS